MSALILHLKQNAYSGDLVVLILWVGWLVGWTANSASVAVEVKVEAELAKIQ